MCGRHAAGIGYLSIGKLPLIVSLNAFMVKGSNWLGVMSKPFLNGLEDYSTPQGSCKSIWRLAGCLKAGKYGRLPCCGRDCLTCLGYP